MSFFSEMDLARFKENLIFLDADGAVVMDGSVEPTAEVVACVEKLASNNKVYLSSNKRDLNRNQALAKRLGIECLAMKVKKPDPRILEEVAVEFLGRSRVVIGDKAWKDGRFARNIGADFVKVDRLRSGKESILVRLTYLFDDFYAACARGLQSGGRSKI